MFFAAAAYVAWNTPYCHDEWKWASPERIELLKRGFAGYNGRYLGNLLALVIVRSRIAKTIVLAGGTTLLAAAMRRTLPGGRLFLLPACMLSLLLIPSELYQQSFGWSAAFVNFVPPVIICLFLTGRMAENMRNGAVPGTGEKICYLLAAFAAALFAEHMTLFAAAEAVWLVIYDLTGKRKMGSVYFMAGSFAGAVCMFTNSAYRRAAGGNAGKKIQVGPGEIFSENIRTVLSFLYEPYVIIAIAAAVLLTLLTVRRLRKDRSGMPGMLAALACVWIFAACALVMHECSRFALTDNEKRNLVLRTALSFVYCFGTAYLLWKLLHDVWMVSWWLGAAVMAVPLLAASPIGARCFFGSYVFECVVVVRLFFEAAGADDDKAAEGLVTAAALVCLLVFGIFYMKIFRTMGAADSLRRERIETGIEEKIEDVSLPAIPYQSYHWFTEPPSEGWFPYFRSFYGVPDDMYYHFE